MPGHAHVHDHDVRAAPLGDCDRALAVGGLADDAHVRRAGEGEAQAFAHDLVVVGDQAGDLVRHVGGSMDGSRSERRGTLQLPGEIRGPPRRSSGRSPTGRGRRRGRRRSSPSSRPTRRRASWSSPRASSTSRCTRPKVSLEEGVTSYLLTAREPVDSPDERCVGVHLEGPFLNPDAAGAIPAGRAPARRPRAARGLARHRDVSGS